ncbi:MAG: Cu(I)-responsive transcriptional regulator, partial [Actinomycetota bacterium]|nr:Cu(I)-responsive transcriptional regulator [Actinomycetota bacterium]
MNIGEAAALSGLPTKTIRYYEEIGLVRPAQRAENGYRDYDETDVRMLNFLQRARSLGFGIEDCRELLALYRDRGRASADVKAIALRRVGDIDRKIAELQTIRAALVELAERCHGDERPACPVLDDLAGGAAAAGRA